jgi:hypothetical protein
VKSEGSVRNLQNMTVLCIPIYAHVRTLLIDTLFLEEVEAVLEQRKQAVTRLAVQRRSFERERAATTAKTGQGDVGNLCARATLALDAIHSRCAAHLTRTGPWTHLVHLLYSDDSRYLSFDLNSTDVWRKRINTLRYFTALVSRLIIRMRYVTKELQHKTDTNIFLR